MTGLSIVTLTFAEGTDNYFARQQVMEKLSTVTLPAGVQPQLAPLSTAVGEVYRYTIEAPGMTEHGNPHPARLGDSSGAAHDAGRCRCRELWRCD